jgi:hypothetical protein
LTLEEIDRVEGLGQRAEVEEASVKVEADA